MVSEIFYLRIKVNLEGDFEEKWNLIMETGFNMFILMNMFNEARETNPDDGESLNRFSID
jgi:hypothetical protein